MLAVITGYGCRLPGADGPEAMWRILEQRACTVGTIRPDRFPVAAYHDPAGVVRGKTYSNAAGQIDDLFAFDPDAFGISRREALQIDPQQRLLLEVVRDAMEHGQHRPDSLSGPRTGVYVACSSFDHMGSFFADMARSDQSFMYGNAMSIVANRVSRHFDLRGPSLTVDTACSAGLTALDLAVAALQSGEIDTAIVAAANALVSPGSFVGFAQAGMLSPTGRCHAFDAAADGYVRSDAAVALVLRRPPVARAAGDRIRARILACGTNTDGLQGTAMAPSSDGQIALMRRVRDMAQRDNREIAMIEAHGTGTPVGDPVEALSVGSVWAEGRDTPLLMGSSKSNFGHSEPAAGLVGLLKAVVSLERGLVPPTVFRTPNPAIDFHGLGLRLADAVVPMQGDLAVVNAFGFGGTNGCVLLQAPGPLPAPPRRLPKAPFLPLSAPTPEALSALAARWSQHLEGADMARMQRLAAAVWHGRDGARMRYPVLLGKGADAVSAEMAELASGAISVPASVPVATSPDVAGITLVFAGNGAQAAGMGLAFHASDVGWRARFNEIAAVFRKAGGPDLAAALGAPDTGRIAVSQGLLFATQVATAQGLIAAGLRVVATIGHSVGEIAAAHVAGLLSLEQAAHIILTRSERLQVLAGTGGMAVVNASAASVTPLLARGVEVAALNGPGSTTLSGPTEALTRTLDTLRRARLAAVRLPVTIPYHSAALDPLRAPMQADFAELVAAPGQIAFFGATAGGQVAGAAFDGAYLWQNARAPVRFQAAAEAAFAAGLRIFAEIAPRPTLAAPLRAIFTDAAEATAVLASADLEMRAGARPADLAARLWQAGAWMEPAAGLGRRRVIEALPLTPYRRTPCRAPLTQTAADPWGMQGYIPLLGRRLNLDGDVWDGEFSAGNPAWLGDHVVNGQAVVPATALFDMALRAAGPAGAALELRDFAIRSPLAPAREGTALRTRHIPETGGVTLQARPRMQSAAWTPVADGTVLAVALQEGPAYLPLMDGTAVARDALYQGLERMGLQYGPAFRLVRALRVSQDSLCCDLDSAPVDQADHAFNAPALDAALHGVAVLLAGRGGVGKAWGPMVPTRVARLQVLGDASDPRHAQVRITARHERGLELQVTLFAGDGCPCLVAEGIELTALPRDRPRPIGLWHEAMRAHALPGRVATDQHFAQRAREMASIVDGLPAASGMDWVHAVCAAIAARLGTGAAHMSVVVQAVPLPSDLRRLKALGFGAVVFTLPDPARLSGERRVLPEGLRGCMVPWDLLARRGDADLVLLPNGLDAVQDAAPEVWTLLHQSGQVLAPNGVVAAPLSRTETQDSTAKFALLFEPDNDPLADLLAKFAPVPVDDIANTPARAERVIVIRPAFDANAAADLSRAMRRVQAALITPPTALTLVAVGCSPVVCAGLQGFVRTLYNEYPSLRPRLILAQAEDSAALAAALASPARPLMTDMRAGDHAQSPQLQPATQAAGETPLRLQTGPAAGLDGLSWRPGVITTPLKPGHVRLRVRAIGLNYRDVMVAQGLLPDHALRAGRFGATCGFECSGEVVASTVAGFTKGDRVLALAGGAAATEMDAPADAVFPMPQALDFAAAATLPVAFATARIALVETARLQAGETVLIHGAAGAVGLAVIRLARRLGAQVLATAGTEAKRALCRAEGAAWVGDSRTLAFAAELRERTEGRGVDVVINTLTGAAAQQSLELLAPFGRFVELGKRGFLEGAQLRSAALRHNQSWAALDLDHMMQHRPERIAGAMVQVYEDLAAGVLEPLPAQRFTAEDAVAAFDTLLHARHVGKVVLSPPDAEMPLPLEATDDPPLDPRGSWLITGGTGAVGLRLARWLRAHGAEKVWLVSRSGAVGRDEQDAILDWIDADAAAIEICACDVAEPAAMAALLARITAEGPPLDGVIHAAGVLRDTPIRDLDPGDIDAVLRAKLTGAEVLDSLTRAAPPRHMLMLSSISVWLGTPGQASYVVANAAMEAVAHRRAAAGLPVRILALGPVAGRGMAVRAGLIRGGGVSLVPADQLGPLAARALTGAHVWLMAARLDWPKLAAGFPCLADPSYDAVLPRDPGNRPAARDILERIDGLSAHAARQEVEVIVLSVLAEVMRTQPDRIDPLRPLTELGLDSLLALELRLEIETRFGRAMPVFGLGEVVTPRLLTKRMLAELLRDKATAETGQADEPAPDAKEHPDD